MKCYIVLSCIFLSVSLRLFPHIDPLRTIGLTPDASQQEIKKQCRTLLLQHHADKKGGSDAQAAKITAACDDLDWRGKDTCNRNNGPLGAACVCPTIEKHSQCVKGFIDNSYRCSCPLSTTEDGSLVPKEQYDYKVWKKQKQYSWGMNGLNTLAEQVADLITSFNQYIGMSGSYAESNALRMYNFLRELLHETPETTSNKAWVNSIEYDFFKKSIIEKMENAGKISLFDRVDYVIKCIEHRLARINYLSWVSTFFYTEHAEEEEKSSYQKQALFLYNFVRELLQEPPAETIDPDWLAYSKWRMVKEADWEKAGIFSLEQKFKDLMPLIEPTGVAGGRRLLWNSSDKLHAYNLVRQLMGLPFAKTVDSEWLSFIKQAPKFAYAHRHDKHKAKIVINKDDYATWKQEVAVAIGYFDIVANPRPDWSILPQLNFYLEHSDNAPGAEVRTIYLYNVLRELLREPIIESLDQVNKKWLETVPYKMWKRAKQYEFDQAGIGTIADKHKNLIQIINPTGTEWLRQLWFSKDQLYAFNFLRELLGQPIVNAIGPQEKEWFEQIKQRYTIK